jgi:hypothetical protein
MLRAPRRHIQKIHTLDDERTRIIYDFHGPTHSFESKDEQPGL